MSANPFQCTEDIARSGDFQRDVVIVSIGKWYWYDETYLVYGPYDIEDAAKQDLYRYAREVLG